MPRIEIPNIEFVHILPEDRMYFKELDPFDRLELILLPGAFAIGAFDTSGDTPLDVGLMVVLKEKDHYVLEWLCMDPDHHNMEIGGAFISMLYDMSLAKGFEKVAVRLTSELRDDPSDYFRERFFTEEVEAPDFFRISISDFLKDGKHLRSYASGTYLPVGELDAAQKNHVLEFIANSEEKFSLYDGTIGWGNIDSEISYVAQDDAGKIKGVFFCMTLGINCYPILLATEDEGCEQGLLSHAVEALQRFDEEGYMLSIFCRTSDMSELAEDILKGEGRIQQMLLMADTAPYKEMIES